MRMLATGAVVALLAAGCAAPPAAAPVATQIATPKPVATIVILSPRPGDAVPSGHVTVSFNVTDVTLVPAATAKKVDDYHVHLALDVDAAQWVGKDVALPTGSANPDPARLVHTAETFAAFENVAPGAHTLVVWLSLSSHVSATPPISATVKFTVR